MEQIKDFVNYCKEWIYDELPNHEGRHEYLCDLGFNLTEGPNADGSITFSSALAKDYLREWWDDCSAYWEYEKFNFGEHNHNPFENPEAYMVCMVIEGCRSLIDHAISELGMDDKWDDYVELSPMLISSIIEKVNEDSRTELF